MEEGCRNLRSASKRQQLAVIFKKMNWPKSIFLAFSIVAIGVVSTTDTSTAVAQTRAQLRCGWFSNPTPANAWLIDKDGEWTIGIQGGYQAEGDWPNIPAAQWVKTNVHYGYGCACVRGTFDSKSQQVIEIKSAYSRPLSACRKDPKLRLKEPR